MHRYSISNAGMRRVNKIQNFPLLFSRLDCSADNFNFCYFVAFAKCEDFKSSGIDTKDKSVAREKRRLIRNHYTSSAPNIIFAGENHFLPLRWRMCAPQCGGEHEELKRKTCIDRHRDARKKV